MSEPIFVSPKASPVTRTAPPAVSSMPRTRWRPLPAIFCVQTCVPSGRSFITYESCSPSLGKVVRPSLKAPIDRASTYTLPASSVSISLPPSSLALPKRRTQSVWPPASCLTTAMSCPPALVGSQDGQEPKSTVPPNQPLR